MGWPDWRQKDRYPPEGVSLARWAWEFLRRWQDYQEFFGRHQVDGQVDMSKLNKNTRRELWDKFAILRTHDPASEFDEQIELHLLVMAVPPYAIFHPVEERNDGDSNMLRATNTGEIVFKFDVRLPLKQQFDWAKAKAENFKDWLKTCKPPQHTFDPDNPAYEPTFLAPDWQGAYEKPEEYQEHLRILDALRAGIKLDDMIAVFEPADDPQGRADKHVMRDRWEKKTAKAKEMMAGGYKFLCAKALKSPTAALPELHAAINERDRLAFEHDVPSLKEQLADDA